MATRTLRLKPLERALLGMAPLAMSAAFAPCGQAAELAGSLGAAFIEATRVSLPGSDDGAAQPGDALYAPFARRGTRWSPSVARTVALEDAAALDGEFRRLDYRLDAKGAIAVPRVIVAKLPPDFRALDGSAQRKTLFFQLVLPLVLAVNENILEERHLLLALSAHLESGGALTLSEHDWLIRLAAQYGGKPDELDDLLGRVDIVPPSLALAQAALETGWGTSHPANAANALFGQFTADEPGARVPAGTTRHGAQHLRAFDHLLDAVRAYAQNLNGSAAYGKFRELRAAERAHDERLDGYKLAGLIQRYSSRGALYVRELRRVMRANALADLDDARLADGVVTRVVFNDG